MNSTYNRLFSGLNSLKILVVTALLLGISAKAAQASGDGLCLPLASSDIHWLVSSPDKRLTYIVDDISGAIYSYDGTAIHAIESADSNGSNAIHPQASNDGVYLVYKQDQSTVWHVNTQGVKGAIVKTPNQQIKGLALDAEADHIYVTTVDSNALWRIKAYDRSGRVLWEQKMNRPLIGNILPSPSNSQAYALGPNIAEINLDKGEIKWLDDGAGEDDGFSISHDGNHLAFGVDGKSAIVKLLDTKSGRVRRLDLGSDLKEYAFLQALSFSLHDDKLYVLHTLVRPGYLSAIPLSGKQIRSKYTNAEMLKDLQLAKLNGADVLVVVDGGNTVRVIDPRKLTELSKLSPVKLPRKSACADSSMHM